MNREQALAHNTERWILFMIYDSYCIRMNVSLQIFNISWGHLSWITGSERGYLGQHFFAAIRKVETDPCVGPKEQRLHEHCRGLEKPSDWESETRTLPLHEDSSVSSPSFIRVLPPHSLQSLCTAEETWTVPSSHHDCSHSRSPQPAQPHQLQFAKHGKDFLSHHSTGCMQDALILRPHGCFIGVCFLINKAWMQEEAIEINKNIDAKQ